MRLELLNGANGMCISLDSTRITEPKIYGILTPIMVWDVPDERIQKILDERKPERHGHCYVDSVGYERCSVCHDSEFNMRYFRFCPHCGARMDGE